MRQLSSQNRNFMRSKDLAPGSYFLKTMGVNANHLDKKYMLDYDMLK